MNVKPICSRNAALTLQISQTEKPRCSAKIDQIRFRRATCRPPFSQNSGSSGRQSSIQRPLRRVVGLVVSGVSVRVMRPTLGAGGFTRLRSPYRKRQLVLTASHASQPHIRGGFETVAAQPPQ